MPDVSLTALLLLGLAALVAGYIDAVVGGGGLIQLPALLVAFPGVAPIHLLATNKLSSICGTSAAAVTYARKVRPDLRTSIALVLCAFGGSAAGSAVASHVPRDVFDPIVLVALVLVGAWVVARPTLGGHTALRWHGWPELVALAIIGAVIGFYDGALGPGTGSFLTIALVGIVGHSFLGATARAKLANWATNFASLCVFVPQGAVMWRLGLVMGACNLLGGWLGARTALRVGTGFVRVVFVLVVACFAIKIGVGLL
ncbi:TSUP family transporter [Nocardioides sp. Kera G14]|uniref:TSUP family transporter n=1 Tax=Nocardioides sp. Kera G14 TaxID=2884264 RepID=UPI001D101A5E|nr:TSUP family transporter [Nocardioides sp. Kera G14]UDY22970.1 TSUP family transporter [Nocardioides sp. Kera G14]